MTGTNTRTCPPSELRSTAPCLRACGSASSDQASLHVCVSVCTPALLLLLTPCGPPAARGKASVHTQRHRDVSKHEAAVHDGLDLRTHHHDQVVPVSRLDGLRRHLRASQHTRVSAPNAWSSEQRSVTHLSLAQLERCLCERAVQLLAALPAQVATLLGLREASAQQAHAATHEVAAQRVKSHAPCLRCTFAQRG